MLRVRKRVTLMAITFSAIFGICWGTNSIVYTLKYVASYDIAHIVLIVVDTMVLFNSAVNPFVYALLSQRFKEKMKRMICCSCYSAGKVQPKSEPRCTELVDSNTIHPTTPSAGPNSTEWCVHLIFILCHSMRVLADNKLVTHRRAQGRMIDLSL